MPVDKCNGASQFCLNYNGKRGKNYKQTGM